MRMPNLLNFIMDPFSVRKPKPGYPHNLDLKGACVFSFFFFWGGGVVIQVYINS